MPDFTQLCLASSNQHKLDEIKKAIGTSGLDQLEILAIEKFECAETGATFLENATQKAQAAAQQTGRWCLADDSGLCVRAMQGRPGIHSARFWAGGDGMNQILESLAHKGDRGAHYVCVLVLADPSGKIQWHTSQEWAGEIAIRPAGINGFGYDPIFIPEGYTQTVAELDPALKNQISHRAKALRAFREYLASGETPV